MICCDFASEYVPFTASSSALSVIVHEYSPVVRLRFAILKKLGMRHREVERIPENRSQFGSQSATRLREGGVASNRESATSR